MHVRPVWTSDEGTMAQETARTRWGRLVQDMVDSMGSSLARNSITAAKKVEGLEIQQQLRFLRQEVVSDAKLTPLNLHGDVDGRWYNERLGVSSQLSWRAAPWLFAECYLYRRVQALFSASVYWHGHDIFKEQKASSFTNSWIAVQDLAAQYNINIQRCPQQDDAGDVESFKKFSDMMQVALWGNATDLSLLSRPTFEDLRSLQKKQATTSMVVDDDLDHLWSYMTSPAYKTSNRHIDIVLDNAGFELFTDLVLAVYLLDQGFAKQVRLHTKVFPWFVSDATPADLESLMNMLRSQEMFPTREFIDPLCDRIAQLTSTGKIVITQHWFWTTGSAFSEMATRAVDLLRDLRGRDLVVFKGDLNYRKLTGDGLWPHTTSFKSALGPLGVRSGLKVLALRTNKADVCVGLESEGRVRALDKESPGGGWLRTGKYGVISFSDGE